MLQVIYSAVILVATTLGAFVGLGGGVIIKPVLDFIGAEPRMQVDFLSCVAVFTMSVVSTGRHIKNKVEFKKDIIAFVSVGSIVGGYAGSKCIELLGNFASQENIRCVQAFLLASLLAAVCIYVSKSTFSFNIRNKIAILAVGFVLGFLASFLGIGGGPINVAVFTLFFSMNVRESAVYSVAVIFFSQISKLITLFATVGVTPYLHQWKTLVFILPAAVIGGFIGSKLNRKSDDAVVRKIFVAVMVMIVVLNVYNGIKYLTV